MGMTYELNENESIADFYVKNNDTTRPEANLDLSGDDKNYISDDSSDLSTSKPEAKRRIKSRVAEQSCSNYFTERSDLRCSNCMTWQNIYQIYEFLTTGVLIQNTDVYLRKKNDGNGKKVDSMHMNDGIDEEEPLSEQAKLHSASRYEYLMNSINKNKLLIRNPIDPSDTPDWNWNYRSSQHYKLLKLKQSLIFQITQLIKIYSSTLKIYDGENSKEKRSDNKSPAKCVYCFNRERKVIDLKMSLIDKLADYAFDWKSHLERIFDRFKHVRLNTNPDASYSSVSFENKNSKAIENCALKIFHLLDQLIGETFFYHSSENNENLQDKLSRRSYSINRINAVAPTFSNTSTSNLNNDTTTSSLTSSTYSNQINSIGHKRLSGLTNRYNEVVTYSTQDRYDYRNSSTNSNRRLLNNLSSNRYNNSSLIYNSQYSNQGYYSYKNANKTSFSNSARSDFINNKNSSRFYNDYSNSRSAYASRLTCQNSNLSKSSYQMNTQTSYMHNSPSSYLAGKNNQLRGLSSRYPSLIHYYQNNYSYKTIRNNRVTSSLKNNNLSLNNLQRSLRGRYSSPISYSNHERSSRSTNNDDLLNKDTRSYREYSSSRSFYSSKLNYHVPRSNQSMRSNNNSRSNSLTSAYSRRNNYSKEFEMGRVGKSKLSHNQQNESRRADIDRSRSFSPCCSSFDKKCDSSINSVSGQKQSPDENNNYSDTENRQGYIRKLSHLNQASPQKCSSDSNLSPRKIISGDKYHDISSLKLDNKLGRNNSNDEMNQRKVILKKDYEKRVKSRSPSDETVFSDKSCYSPHSSYSSEFNEKEKKTDIVNNQQENQSNTNSVSSSDTMIYARSQIITNKERKKCHQDSNKRKLNAKNYEFEIESVSLKKHRGSSEQQREKSPSYIHSLNMISVDFKPNPSSSSLITEIKKNKVNETNHKYIEKKSKPQADSKALKRMKKSSSKSTKSRSRINKMNKEHSKRHLTILSLPNSVLSSNTEKSLLIESTRMNEKNPDIERKYLQSLKKKSDILGTNILSNFIIIVDFQLASSVSSNELVPDENFHSNNICNLCNRQAILELEELSSILPIISHKISNQNLDDYISDFSRKFCLIKEYGDIIKNIGYLIKEDNGELFKEKEGISKSINKSNDFECKLNLMQRIIDECLQRLVIQNSYLNELNDLFRSLDQKRFLMNETDEDVKKSLNMWIKDIKKSLYILQVNLIEFARSHIMNQCLINNLSFYCLIDILNRFFLLYDIKSINFTSI